MKFPLVFSVFFLVVFSIMTALLFLPGIRPVSSEERQPVTQIMALSSGSSILEHINKNMSPLVLPAASYCTRDCDHCRSDCYQRYRVHCYGYECKQHFVLCMRECWNTICRWC